MTMNGISPKMVGRAKKTVLAVVVAALLASLAVSQVDGGKKNAADSAWLQRDWRNAIELYRQVLEDDPRDGTSWFRLAFAYHNDGQYAEAVPAFERALEHRAYILTARYNLACSLARLGQTERALSELERVVAAGFTPTTQIQTDPDFQHIRNTSKFQEIVRRTEDPVLYLEGGPGAQWLRGAWAFPQGTMTANVSTKGFVHQVEVLEGGSRAVHLVVYFSAAERSWHVRGADRDGAAYSGKVRVRDGSLECQGVFPDGRPARVRVSAEGETASVATEAQSDGAWVPVQSYRLEEMRVSDGGR